MEWKKTEEERLMQMAQTQIDQTLIDKSVTGMFLTPSGLEFRGSYDAEYVQPKRIIQDSDRLALIEGVAKLIHEALQNECRDSAEPFPAWNDLSNGEKAHARRIAQKVVIPFWNLIQAAKAALAAEMLFDTESRELACGHQVGASYPWPKCPACWLKEALENLPVEGEK